MSLYWQSRVLARTGKSPREEMAQQTSSRSYLTLTCLHFHKTANRQVIDDTNNEHKGEWGGSESSSAVPLSLAHTIVFES